MAPDNEKQSLARSQVHLPFYRRLRVLLIVAFVVLAVAPMTLVTFLISTQLSAQTRDQLISQLESVAEAKSQTINLWLADSHSVLQAIDSGDARDRRLVTLTSPTSFGFAQTQGVVNRVFVSVVNDSDGFNEIFFFDLGGTIQASSDSKQIGKIVGRQPYFEHSFDEPHFQPPYYEIGSGDLTAIVSLPVRDTNRRVVGALAGRLNLNRLGAIMLERSGLGESGETYLVSAQSGYLLTPSRFEGYEQNRRYTSEGIEKALAGVNGSGAYVDYRTPPQQVMGVYRWLPEFQAAMLAEIEEEEAFQAFNRAQQLAIGLALVAAVVAVVLGFVIALSVSQPVTTLTRVATQLASGDLTERAALRTRNEIGLLASAFNNMADRLEELVESLESRVADRTRDLRVAAQVSERVATILDPNDLLPQVVELTRDSFNLYHTHIYLYDTDRANLVLAQGAGEAGQIMKSRGHRIPTSARSLVARAARENAAVIVDDVKADPNFLANPLLPDTRSEAALPLTIGDRVIGVLDVQSEQVARFDSDLISVLSTFVGQIAVALDNARLFSEMERTSRQDRVLGVLAQEIQRANNMDDVLRSATRELGKALRVSETTIELHLPDNGYSEE